MIRVAACLMQRHKNCRKYPVLLCFTEFQVLRLLSVSFSFPPASIQILAGSGHSWCLGAPSHLCHTAVLKADSLLSKLIVLRAYWTMFYGPDGLILLGCSC